MTAILTIALSNEVLDALKQNQTLTIRLETAGGSDTGSRSVGRPRGRPAGKSGGSTPREGSLPARILEWASTRSKPFGTAEVTKKFKLSRAHSSMLLSRLAAGNYPIRRESRGIYSYDG